MVDTQKTPLYAKPLIRFDSDCFSPEIFKKAKICHIKKRYKTA